MWVFGFGLGVDDGFFVVGGVLMIVFCGLLWLMLLGLYFYFCVVDVDGGMFFIGLLLFRFGVVEWGGDGLVVFFCGVEVLVVGCFFFFDLDGVFELFEIIKFFILFVLY